MLPFKLQNGQLWKVALAVAIVVAIGLMATAIYAQGGTITACVNSKNGNVRIVGSTGDCKNQENVIQWSALGQQGQSGEQGPAGPPGPTGPQGPAGVSGYEVVRADFPLAAGGFLRNTIMCPSGKVALGGGATVVGQGTADFHLVLEESGPGAFNGATISAWLLALENLDGVQHIISLYAICANVTP